METTFLRERTIAKNIAESINKTLVTALLLFLGIIVALTYSFLSQILLTRLALGTCQGFSSKEEMISSFNNGNTRLDKDHDGIPCESRW